jgi:hypothetical protein
VNWNKDNSRNIYFDHTRKLAISEGAVQELGADFPTDPVIKPIMPLVRIWYDRYFPDGPMNQK